MRGTGRNWAGRPLFITFVRLDVGNRGARKLTLAWRPASSGWVTTDGGSGLLRLLRISRLSVMVRVSERDNSSKGYCPCLG